jgi:hypothetical protein
MFMLFVTVLWAAMLISPFVLLYLFLPSGRDCPRCAAETVPVRSRCLRPVRRIAGVRWCMSCGWEGITRVTTVRTPTPKYEVVPEDAGETDDDAPWRSA